jgi:predicted nucleotidyltransferase component of viral defense system
MSSGLPRSVQTRLVNHAHSLRVDPNVVLARYAAERFLYRLSRSSFSDRFVLKGALLMLVWLGETLRPTRDADLLGFGELDAESLARIFAEVCEIPVEPDCLEFDVKSLRVAPIRAEDAYGGQRVSLIARLGPARIRVQVDIGIGDDVFPEPVWLEYPSLLGLPPARLRAYCKETAIAEKVHAMVELGSKNSRMRDFFDIQALAAAEKFDGRLISRPLVTTFARRTTTVPSSLPLALTQAFAEIEGKPAQWAAFVRRLPGTSAPSDLASVVEAVSLFVGPVVLAAGKGERFVGRWEPGGPWRR